MNASELKYQVEQAGHEPYFFTRKTMQFFGDTMRNYGVRSRTFTLQTHWDNDGKVYSAESRTITVDAWELYRKHPVKHGLSDSAYFDKQTFKRVFIENC